MRCHQCQFENIPGQQRCLRCGAVLQAGAITGSVNPPRMAPWKGPFRVVVRWFRLKKAMRETIPKLRGPVFLREIPQSALWGLVLSIVPGLAHLAGGRFREVRWFVLMWLMAISGGIFFYNSNMGITLLGLAVGLHGWIALSHTLKNAIEGVSYQCFCLVILMGTVGLAYFGIRNYAFGDFVFGYTNLTVPYQDIQSGDMLLARRSLSGAAYIHRGSLVLVPVRRVSGHGDNTSGTFMFGQVVGFSGEQIKIEDDIFLVNGRPLDDKQCPVPQWLLGKDIETIKVPPESYFVSTEYYVYIHGNIVLNANFVSRTCVMRTSEIVAGATMRWFPLARRGFLRVGQ